MDQEVGATTKQALRFALIGGAAGIARTHIDALQQLPAAQIVGLADVNLEAGAARADQLGCPFFADHRRLLVESQPDVAVIVTPHPFHAPIAIDCFAAGAHVLVEKPIAVEVAEADQMNAAADAAGKLLVVNFQNRFRPVIQHAKALIDRGEIGSLVRTLCVEPWYRSAAYYRSATWRGSWRGEGGGILMNQAPHTLDLLCYLAGVPRRVWGWTRTFRHAIEVEDQAQAMFEYANGAPGYFTSSTVEAGSARRLEIVGDRGALELNGPHFTIKRFDQPLSEHSATAPGMWDSPSTQSETLDLPGDGGGHLAVYQDLIRAIETGTSPSIDGRQGTMSLELANAITLSSFTERPVDLPLDRAAYHELLLDLREGVTGRLGDRETRR